MAIEEYSILLIQEVLGFTAVFLGHHLSALSLKFCFIWPNVRRERFVPLSKLSIVAFMKASLDCTFTHLPSQEHF